MECSFYKVFSVAFREDQQSNRDLIQWSFSKIWAKRYIYPFKNIHSGKPYNDGKKSNIYILFIIKKRRFDVRSKSHPHLTAISIISPFVCFWNICYNFGKSASGCWFVCVWQMNWTRNPWHLFIVAINYFKIVLFGVLFNIA